MVALGQPCLQPGLPHLPPQGLQLTQGDDSSVLNNRLVGLSLGRMRVTGLAEPLEITFSHQRQPPVSSPPRRAVTQGQTGGWAPLGTWANRHRTLHCLSSTSTQEKPLGPYTQLCPGTHAHSVHICPHALRNPPIYMLTEVHTGPGTPTCMHLALHTHSQP